MKVNKFCPVLVFWKWYINFRELFLVLKFQFIHITEKMTGKRFEFMSWLNLYFDQLRDSISLLKIWVIFFRCGQYRPHLLNVISICISFFEEVTRPGRGCITKARLDDLQSVASKNLFFLCRNVSLVLILFINFRNIDSLTFFASNMQPTYVTLECCLIWIVLSVIFSFGAFFILHVEAKSVNLGVCLPKWIVSLLSENHSQVLVKSPFNVFLISLTIFPWETKQESSAYRNIFNFRAWGMSLTSLRNSKCPRMDTCGTTHVIL